MLIQGVPPRRDTASHLEGTWNWFVPPRTDTASHLKRGSEYSLFNFIFEKTVRSRWDTDVRSRWDNSVSYPFLVGHPLLYFSPFPPLYMLDLCVCIMGEGMCIIMWCNPNISLPNRCNIEIKTLFFPSPPLLSEAFVSLKKEEVIAYAHLISKDRKISLRAEKYYITFTLFLCPPLCPPLSPLVHPSPFHPSPLFTLLL